MWAPVPPVIAVTFFERQHGNDPLLLQYAHRVLKEHPVDLTFFFVPQIVQALRFDDLGKYLSSHAGMVSESLVFRVHRAVYL